MNKTHLILRIAVVLVMFLLPVTPVLADVSVDVTVTAKPLVTGGIANFTITYVSDTQLDFSWNFIGEATKIMIRGKYGGYPANIPDKYTEPSDGYLVYYGDATSCSDLSMDFDENPGPIYYTAWAQKGDGTWYTDMSTGQKESETLLLIGLILLAMGFTISGAILKKGYLAFAGAGSWMITSIYCFSRATAEWDTYFCLGFLFIALVLVSTFSPLAWRETTPAGEVPEEPDARDLREEMEEVNRIRNQYAFLYGKRQPIKRRVSRRMSRFGRTGEE